MKQYKSAFRKPRLESKSDSRLTKPHAPGISRVGHEHHQSATCSRASSLMTTSATRQVESRMCALNGGEVHKLASGD